MIKVKVAALALSLGLLLAACAPQAIQTPVAPLATPAAQPALPVRPTLAGPPVTTPPKAAWEVKWEETAAAARKEGTVVLYTALGGQQRQFITNAFTSRYGVRVEAVTGMSYTVAPKIFTEQRAGIYSADAWLGGSTTYVPLKGALDNLEPALVLPELTQPDLIKKTWHFGELSWGDKARTMLTSLMKYSQPISTNKNLVKSDEIATYRDILDPKWKGKISIQDPRVSGMGLMWFSVALEVGDVDASFVRDLVTKQELFVTRDLRLQVDWLTRGKHAIAIAPDTPTLTEFIGLGAQVSRVNLGTPFTSGGTSGIGIMKGAPNPNATRLFINWLLSQEGQTLHSKAVGAQSQRLDVPTSHLDPSIVLKPGGKIYRADYEEFAIKQNSYYIGLAKDIIGP